jgi:hypothetical protein
VKFPILALRRSLLTTALVEDGKEEGAVVQSTVLDRVVQLGYLTTGESEDADVNGDDVTHPRRIKLFLRDITEVFEELLPTFAEEPRLVTTTPMVVIRSAEV